LPIWPGNLNRKHNLNTAMLATLTDGNGRGKTRPMLHSGGLGPNRKHEVNKDS
jgi:hypothetical protein